MVRGVSYVPNVSIPCMQNQYPPRGSDHVAALENISHNSTSLKQDLNSKSRRADNAACRHTQARMDLIPCMVFKSPTPQCNTCRRMCAGCFSVSTLYPSSIGAVLQYAVCSIRKSAPTKPLLAIPANKEPPCNRLISRIPMPNNTYACDAQNRKRVGVRKKSEKTRQYARANRRSARGKKEKKRKEKRENDGQTNPNQNQDTKVR